MTNMATKDDNELIQQLAFYGAYHSRFWNQVIHIVFVPYIFWGLIMLLNFTPNFIDSKFLDQLHLPLNVGLFVVAFYVCYYLYLGDYPVAVPYSFILIAIAAHANAVFQSTEHPILHIIASQIIGWGLQIAVGHNMVEKRKPALFDSLFDSVVMAPLFTFYEVLFFFGFRKEFKARLDKQICVNIGLLNEKKKIPRNLGAIAKQQ